MNWPVDWLSFRRTDESDTTFDANMAGWTRRLKGDRRKEGEEAKHGQALQHRALFRVQSLVKWLQFASRRQTTHKIAEKEVVSKLIVA